MADVDVSEWGLSPGFWSYRKVFVKTILDLTPVEQSQILKDAAFFQVKVVRVDVATSSSAVVPQLLQQQQQWTIPTSTVEIAGVVTSIHSRTEKVLYSVDDGTGVIPCLLWRKRDLSTKEYCQEDSGSYGILLGQFVVVQGWVGSYRNVRQINSQSILVNEDPNAESLFWLRTIQLDQDVYSQPPPQLNPPTS